MCAQVGGLQVSGAQWPGSGLPRGEALSACARPGAESDVVTAVHVASPACCTNYTYLLLPRHAPPPPPPSHHQTDSMRAELEDKLAQQRR